MPTIRCDLYRQLQELIKALDEFLGCTGPNGDPSLDEAVGAGGLDTNKTVLALLVWSLARRVFVTMPQVSYPYRLDTSEWGGPSVGLILSGALVSLHATMKTLFDRWEFPMDIWGEGVHIDSGRYRAAGDEDGMWHVIIPPIVEPAEHAAILRCRNGFADVKDHLDSEGWGESLKPPSQTEVESGPVETKPAAGAKPTTVKHPDEATVRVRATERRGPIKAARAKAAREAIATAAKPPGEPEDPAWGKPFRCSLTGLFKGMRLGKYSKAKLDRMVKGNELKWEELDAGEYGPLGYWHYRAWIKDETRRGYMSDYVDKMTVSDPAEKKTAKRRPGSSARIDQDRP